MVSWFFLSPNYACVAGLKAAFRRPTECVVVTFTVSNQRCVRAVLAAKAANLGLGGHVRRITQNTVACKCVCYPQNAETLRGFVQNVIYIYDEVENEDVIVSTEQEDLTAARSKFKVFCVSNTILSQIAPTERSVEPEEDDRMSIMSSDSVRSADRPV
jgi:hypothetical protein